MMGSRETFGQLALFGANPPLHLQMPRPPRVERSRTSDPESSHEAHERRERGLSAQSEAVLQLIRKHCTRGLTAWEIARAEYGNTRDGDDWHRRIGRRAPELAKVGFIRRGPIRLCSVDGGNAVTWSEI